MSGVLRGRSRTPVAGAHRTLDGTSLNTFLSAYLDEWKGTIVVRHNDARVL